MLFGYGKFLNAQVYANSGGKLVHQIIHSVRSAIVFYYPRILKHLFRSEIYSVPVILHILPTVANPQGDDQLNRVN